MREYYIINDEMSEQKHVDGRQNAKVVESETNDNDGDEYQVETHKWIKTKKKIEEEIHIFAYTAITSARLE